MIVLDDCQSYLQEICCRYKQWWSENALTEAIAARQATFSFEQMVQTEEKDSEGKPRETLPLPIFKAIQDYIESEHILLVGSPGAGKSTALLQCGIRLAKAELEKSNPKIPVLVQLKRYNSDQYKGREGLLVLIRDALKLQLSKLRPRPKIETSDVEELLNDERLILLLDGLNEMAAANHRTHLIAFRKEYDQIPLICSTRELGSGDLGIRRKLEIQPLESKKIERFLQECIPEQKQKVLQLLNRDNRELSRTPFVLWMLYDLFQKQGTEVETLAEAFRKFFRSFNKNYKEDVPVTDERRKDWSSWLKHLAFSMLDTSDPNDPGLVISRERAKQVLDDQFGKHSGDSSRVEELLKYHVLESVNDEEINFHHQLIQEYYAAEALLERLQKHSEWLERTSEQKWTRFQQNYLNYIKWTEAIALVFGFPEIEEQAEQLVKSALDVDLYLAGSLAGAVKSKLQDRTISLITDCEIPQQIKVELLGKIQSEIALSRLLEINQTSDFELRRAVIRALGNIPLERSIAEIVKVLDDPDSEIRQIAVYRLGKTKDQRVIPHLCKALFDSTAIICEVAADALAEIDSREAISCLVQNLNSLNSKFYQYLSNLLPNVDGSTSYEEIKNLTNLPKILSSLINCSVRQVRQAVIEAIYNASSGKETDVFKGGQYDLSPYGELIELASHEIGLSMLLKASSILENLEDENYTENEFFIENEPEQINSDIEPSKLLSQLEEALKEQDTIMISATAYALGKEGCSKLLQQLIDALESSTDREHSLAIANAVIRADECSVLQKLWKIHLDKPTHCIHFAISAIQSRCGFYNYEIYQYAQEVNKLGNSGDFIGQLYKDIDQVIYQIERNPELRQEDKEDRLTIEIVGALRISGYNASHDCKIGGHVDLTVEKNDFVWLGEAKIYRDNNYLWEGFQQLTTRYSTGNINQNSGGLLIYIKKGDAKSIMERWQEYLLNKKLSNYKCDFYKTGSSSFISSHTHERSGQPFHVRHIPVLLYSDPKDKSGRRRKEQS
ncbi:MAG: HEAT repeat domain-containing protein [Myxacorys chilensis ATA2-1-KO14]|jgi:HEAT repeat protein|nr:HEAT repeat domain-containing protein [Myxacorys chilensis ATA2-1-KO14]